MKKKYLKRRFLTALAFLQSFSSDGQIQKTPAIVKDGLIAHYLLSGNCRDESGNEQHALPFNTLLTANRRGTPNTAYHFSGYNSFISCPLKNNDFQALTISCWAYWNASHLQGAIFFAGLSSMDGFGLIVGDGVCGMGDRVCLLLGGNPGGTCGAWVAPNPIPVHQWVHLALVKKDNDWRIFMDGKLAGSVTHGYNKPSVPFQIGGTIENKRGSIIGDISDLLFYNRALSDAEIMTLYNR